VLQEALGVGAGLPVLTVPGSDVRRPPQPSIQA